MSKRILIFEDNPLNLKLFKDLLELEKLSVACALEGLNALETVRNAGPDLIILDLQLPDISGHELIGQFKNDKELGSIPILVVTALVGKEDEAKARANGCDAFLPKPISVLTFIATVRELLEIS